jgi:hypothetical protein
MTTTIKMDLDADTAGIYASAPLEGCDFNAGFFNSAGAGQCFFVQRDITRKG